MILGKNLSASAFFFCLGIYSGSRRKFLPTGRFGTFFCLEVSLGIYHTECTVISCYMVILRGQITPNQEFSSLPALHGPPQTSDAGNL